jgi:[ribosomal protein S5]-alanine N-acetyltransferase
MDVALSQPSPSDAAEFIDAARDSIPLHAPWLRLPDTPELFAAYLERAARDDQASYLIRHRECGSLVGVVNVNNIVRGGLQSGALGYGAFASHAGQGLMTRGMRAVLGSAFGDLGLHRVEANIQPATPAPSAWCVGSASRRRGSPAATSRSAGSGATTSAGRCWPRTFPPRPRPAGRRTGPVALRSPEGPVALRSPDGPVALRSPDGPVADGWDAAAAIRRPQKAGAPRRNPAIQPK